MTSKSYTLLLGGIGGDSHSVGLYLLRNYLTAAGFQIHFLGIQNSLEDFFKYAPFVNAVLISTLDGHSKQYLKTFPDLIAKFTTEGVRWYLGGNLEIHEDVEKTERYFRELGFHLVFAKFRSVQGLDKIISEDIQKSFAQPKSFKLIQSNQSIQGKSSVENKLTEDCFFKERKEVLSHWPTGLQASAIESNAEFILKGSLFSDVLRKAQQTDTILLQPRCGVAIAESQLEIFKNLENAGVQVASYQIDSLTRNNFYDAAQEGIKNSKKQGVSSLNGFPLINHGVAVARRIKSQLKIPLQVRHSTRDPRLLAEIAYASGVSSFEGGAICYNIPYYKTYPLQESLDRWAYVDRLTAYYYDQFGIRLNREYFGTLTAALIPPSLAITVCILETLLSAQQGVKNMSLGYAEQGNRIQDIAAIQSIIPLAKKYLVSFGYHDVELTTVFHQYMAAFPSDLTLAKELIFQSGVTALFSGATRVMTKTAMEAIRVPSVQENIESLQWIQLALQAAKNTQVDQSHIAQEIQMIEVEVEALMNGVLELGQGSIQVGIICAFEKGWLDVPFSPSIFNAGKVVTLRDAAGAVRYFDAGNMPFGNEIKQRHEDLLSSRKATISKQSVYSLLEDDLRSIAEGKHRTWPLDEIR